VYWLSCFLRMWYWYTTSQTNIKSSRPSLQHDLLCMHTV